MLQRVTAIILVLYTVAFVVSVFIHDIDGFDGWVAIFSTLWMKLFTLAASISLIYHAWVGIREIWMDYIQPVKVRMGLQIFSIIWLMGCGIWIVAIILQI